MSLLLPRQTLRREQASWRMNGKRLCLRQHTNLLVARTQCLSVTPSPYFNMERVLSMKCAV